MAESHRDERFALFINYVSPHAPYLPEPQYLEPIDRAAVRPDNKRVRRYLAEIRKDDAGIGHVLDQLDILGLTSKTAVVVTADHGETMSEAHDWIAVNVAKGVPSGRFTHLSTMWDEAARVPLIFSLPGRIPENRRPRDEVQTTDIVPTLLELLGVAVPSEMDGKSLVSVLDGKPMQVRPVIVEGRGAEAIRLGDWRLIVRSPVARRIRRGESEFEKAVELYNIKQDPGERRDVSATNKDTVLRLQGELRRQLASITPTAVAKSVKSSGIARIRLATSGHIASVSGSLRLVGDGKLTVNADGCAANITPLGHNEFRIVAQSKPDSTIGFNLIFEPANADISWQWWLDGAPWPANDFFAGPLGLVAPRLAEGLHGSNSDELVAFESPYISPTHETGIFVARDMGLKPASSLSESAQIEAQQAMQAWGYVRKPEVVKKRPRSTLP